MSAFAGDTLLSSAYCFIFLSNSHLLYSMVYYTLLLIMYSVLFKISKKQCRRFPAQKNCLFFSVFVNFPHIGTLAENDEDVKEVCRQRCPTADAVRRKLVQVIFADFKLPCCAVRT